MSAEVIAFIQQYAGDVIQSVRGTGIFPSVTMAQMIIEGSGNDERGIFHIGRGAAVRAANNYFGIKADSSWKGAKVALSTPRDGQPVSYFRVYASALESLKDHANFLLANARYRLNGVFVAQTPQEQTAALQRAGYAESPTYSQTLNKMIADYNLQSLDVVPAVDYKKVILIAGSVLVLSAILYYREEIEELFKGAFAKTKQQQLSYV